MHNLAEEYEIDIAIDEFCFRGTGGFIDQCPVNTGFVTTPLRLQIEIRAQAGEMGHKIADGYWALPTLKFRQIHVYAVIDPDPPLLKQLHQAADCGNDLGERRDI